jgi:hypothetical protein
MSDRICSMDGCEGKHKSRGWCLKHYSRWQAHGTPLGDISKPDPSRVGRISATGSSKVCSVCLVEKHADEFAKAATGHL